MQAICAIAYRRLSHKMPLSLMEKDPSLRSGSALPAMVRWAIAVDAVLRDIDRIIRGGTTNPTLTSELLAAVEVARQRCVDDLELQRHDWPDAQQPQNPTIFVKTLRL